MNLMFLMFLQVQEVPKDQVLLRYQNYRLYLINPNYLMFLMFLLVLLVLKDQVLLRYR